MASDPAFSDMIRKWTAADTQIRNLNNQLRDLRSARDTLTTNVCDYMKTKGLDKRKIEISDSTLSYCEKTETSSLSYSYLEKRLGDIIPDKDQVEYIITYLKEKRETKKVPDLRRVYRNDTKGSTYDTKGITNDATNE
jgi:hypothetical protein